MDCTGKKRTLLRIVLLSIVSGAVLLGLYMKQSDMTVGEVYYHLNFTSRQKTMTTQFKFPKLHNIPVNLSAFPLEEDFNCIRSIPSELVGTSTDQPIIIPDSLQQPLPVLKCLYHRYLTTIQTPCSEPKAFGIVNIKGGYICVDGNLLPRKTCKVAIFGSYFNSYYQNQLKAQYQCDIKFFKETKAETVPPGRSSSLKKTLRQYMASEQRSNDDIHMIALTVTDDQFGNDIYVMNELLNTESFMVRIRQISVKIFLVSTVATRIHYEQRFAIFKKIYSLGFRIFYFDQEENCEPDKRSLTKFCACYSVYFVRWHEKSPAVLTLPDKSILRSMDELNMKRHFERYLGSLQTMCQQVIRVGNIQDGGWNVCHDELYRPRSPCLVYSFGIDNNWSFDEDIPRTYGCTVFSIDPSINRKDYLYSGKIRFYDMGLGGVDVDRNGWKIRKFGTIVKMLSNTTRFIDIVKLDIESAEWPALKEMISTGSLKNVGQLYVEFHGEPDFERLCIIKDLYTLGFRIFFVHKNLNGGCRRPLDGGYTTHCFEIYFLNLALYEERRRKRF